MVLTQEQIRKLGVIIISATAVYALPWTRGILSILDNKLLGTNITGVHLLAFATMYFAYRVWYRNL